MGQVYVTGDTHGDFKRIGQFCTEFNTSKDDVLIILGDSGINYYLNYRDRNLKQYIAKLPITLFVIRGNHDCPLVDITNLKTWHSELFFGNEVIVEDDYSNIKYTLDGYDYDIPAGDTFYHAIVIGGAYSVDKEYRLLRGWSWFEYEQLTSDEMEEIYDYMLWLSKNNPIDCILSHTCPLDLQPVDLFMSGIDSSKVDNTMEKFLNKVFYNISHKAWLFGHYHADRYYNYKDKKIMMLFNEIINFADFMTLTRNAFMFNGGE